MTTSTPSERGRELEQRIAAFFAGHGYAVETNRVLHGRSGGRHEIDVLAEKSDLVASYRVAIECKAWHHPIEKDVVSKLHYVMSDLGLNKGVIVSLAGARSGADTAAEQLGIDIWGPDQLRHHFGDSIFAAVSAADAQSGGRALTGWAFDSDAESARRLIAGTGRGRLGLRTHEELVWFASVWIPAFFLELSVAQPSTRRLRQHVASTYVRNIYEALDGVWLGPPPSDPVDIAAGEVTVLKPLIRDTQVPSRLRKAVEARLKVTSAAAIERHEKNLSAHGLPVPLRGMTVDGARLVHLPVFVGMLRGQRDRIAAVRATNGQLDDRLGQSLTGQVSHLRAAFAVR